MISKSKFQTLQYVFLLTAVPQILIIGMFSTIACFAHIFNVTNIAGVFLLASALFVAMLFGFVCVSIFTQNYGLSIFSISRNYFNPGDYQSTIKEVSFVEHKTFFGKRSIEVRTHEKPGGAPIIISALLAIVIALTGIIKFVIETIRVILSDERQGAWEGCREDLVEDIEIEGVFQFFKVPIIVIGSFIVSWFLVLLMITGSKIKHNPDKIDFEIIECTETGEVDDRELAFDIEITNRGRGKISDIGLTIYFKDKNGNLLYEKTMHIDTMNRDKWKYFISKNERSQFEFKLFESAMDEKSKYIFDQGLDNVEISIDLITVEYKDEIVLDLPEEEMIILKPIK